MGGIFLIQDQRSSLTDIPTYINLYRRSDPVRRRCHRNLDQQLPSQNPRLLNPRLPLQQRTQGYRLTMNKKHYLRHLTLQPTLIPFEMSWKSSCSPKMIRYTELRYREVTKIDRP